MPEGCCFAIQSALYASGRKESSSYFSHALSIDGSLFTAKRENIQTGETKLASKGTDNSHEPRDKSMVPGTARLMIYPELILRSG